MAKVMLIEDDRLVSRTLEIVFKKAGHEVTVATDGFRGLKLFQTEKPDIVITDIVMPDKDGIETIQELRKLSTSVPIIAISGGGRTKNFEFLRVAHKLGASDVLRKPFSNDDILKLVEHHLKASSAG